MENNNKTAKEEALRKEETKNTEKLIKSVMALTDSINGKGKPVPAQTPSGPSAVKTNGGGILGAIKTGLGVSMGAPLSILKSLGTKDGLLDLAASRAGGGILSNILSAGADNVRARKAEQSELAEAAAAKEDKRAKYITGYLSGTDKGRNAVKDMGMEGAIKHGADIYKRKGELELEINATEDRRRALDESGVHGAGLTSAEFKEHASKIMELNTLTTRKLEPQTATNKSDHSLDRPGASSGDKEPQSDKLGKNPDETKLLSLGEEQLVELKKLVSASTESEEDKLEKKIKRAENQPAGTPSKSKEKEKDKSLLDTIMDKIPGIDKIKNFLPKITKLLPAAGRIGGLLSKIALPAAAVLTAGSGIMDEASGKKIENAEDIIPEGWNKLNPFEYAMNAGRYTGNKINNGVEAVTGGSIGTGAASAVNAVSGALGFETEEDKLKKGQDASDVAGATSLLAKGTKISNSLAEKVTKLGMKVPADMIISSVSKQSATSREVQADRAVANSAESETKKTEKTTQNISAPVTNISNASSGTSTRVHTRTPEPTYNRILAYNMA
jgi:hypothetical protein